jgi:hypothetical protein
MPAVTPGPAQARRQPRKGMRFGDGLTRREPTTRAAAFVGGICEVSARMSSDNSTASTPRTAPIEDPCGSVRVRADAPRALAGFGPSSGLNVSISLRRNLNMASPMARVTVLQIPLKPMLARNTGRMVPPGHGRAHDRQCAQKTGSNSANRGVADLRRMRTSSAHVIHLNLGDAVNTE